ncbi:MAG: MFS transporter [Solirubrobacterales bacterium]|nr:MFS transporter [Solirubrobacterales bacterium]
MSTYLRVLRHRDFRYLFAGQAASVVGDRLVVVALALFIAQRTGSATDLGLVLGAQSLPLVALILFGGVWADRLPRHRIMLVADALRAALHGVLAVLIFTGAVAIWQLVAIEALFGGAQAFFEPAYSGLLPQTVPESLVQDARALTESVANVAMLLGPALATALVLGVGAGEAFAIDAATFVFSALLLTRVHPRPRGESAAAGSMLHELRVGFREVRSRTWVWVIIAVFTGAVLCVYAQWFALAPVIARDAYGGAGVFGVLEAIGGAGAVCGALLALRWQPERPLLTGMLLVLAWPIEAGAFALHAPLGFVLAWSFASGFGFSLLMIWWETALVRHIPPGALSRVSAWDWMGSLALLPFGYLAAGPLAEMFGPATVLAVGSAIGVVLLLVGLLPRSVRELGGEPTRERFTESSAQQLAGQVEIEPGGEAKVAYVDPLVGTVDQR